MSFSVPTCFCSNHHKQIANTVEISKRMAIKRKVICVPKTKDSIGALVTSIFVINLVWLRVTNENIAPTNGTPTVCPNILDKDNKPEVIPNLSFGAAHIMALLLGD